MAWIEEIIIPQTGRFPALVWTVEELARHCPNGVVIDPGYYDEGGGVIIPGPVELSYLDIEATAKANGYRVEPDERPKALVFVKADPGDVP